MRLGRTLLRLRVALPVEPVQWQADTILARKPLAKPPQGSTRGSA